MPKARLEAEQRGGIIIVRIIGAVTVEQVRASFDEHNTAEHRLTPRLWDLREATFTEVDTDGIWDLAGYTSDRIGTRRRVALLIGEDVQYGMIRMYDSFRSDSPVDLRIIRDDEAAAIAWLRAGLMVTELPPETIEPD